MKSSQLPLHFWSNLSLFQTWKVASKDWLFSFQGCCFCWEINTRTETNTKNNVHIKCINIQTFLYANLCSKNCVVVRNMHGDFIAICFLRVWQMFVAALHNNRHATNWSRKFRIKEKKNQIIDSHVCVPTSKRNREFFLQETLSFKPNTSINCKFHSLTFSICSKISLSRF